MRRVLLLAVFTLVVTACSIEPDATAGSGANETKQGLDAFVVVTRTASVFQGYRTLSGRTVNFYSEVVGPHYVLAELDVDGTNISMQANGDVGDQGIVGFTISQALWQHGEDDLALLEQLTQDFETVIPWPANFGDPDTANGAEGLLRQYTSFFATARHYVDQGVYTFDLASINVIANDTYYPDGSGGDSLAADEPVQGTATSGQLAPVLEGPDAFEGQWVPPGSTYCAPPCNCVNDEDPGFFGGFAPEVQFLPVCCGRPFGFTRAWFSDTRATTPFGVPNCTGTPLRPPVTCGVGSGGAPCRGRCGFRCFAVGVYTQDCYDHDVCSGTFTTNFWSGDRSCGDEFWEAASDTAVIYGYSFYSVVHTFGASLIPLLLGCF